MAQPSEAYAPGPSLLRPGAACRSFCSFSSLSYASRNFCNDSIFSLLNAKNNIKLVKNALKGD
jgi:hypothetical protein